MLGRRSVGLSKDDENADGAVQHVKGLGSRVDDLIYGLHRKVEGHELDDGMKAVETRLLRMSSSSKAELRASRSVKGLPESEINNVMYPVVEPKINI